MRTAHRLCLSALAGAASLAGGQVVTMTSPNGEVAGRFGYSVAGVPDVDNNGRGEMAIGAPYENVNGINDAGRIYLYSALGARKATITSPAPESGGLFGYSVAGAPDVNGDLKGDIVVGGPFENPGGSPADSGRAYVYSGATGVRRLTLISPNAEALGLFGLSVAGIADVNGDGKGDVAVGAPNENPLGSPADCGRVYIFNGFTGALLRTLASPNQQANGGFGTSIAAVPDLNGDGRGDLLVGALFEHPGGSPDRCGRAYVFSGATGALLFTLVSPQQQLEGTFGNSVAGVPDANGDGKGDLLVGAPYEKVGNNPDASGRAYLYSGANGALLRQFAAGSPIENDVFGFSIAGCTDLNGDGRGDIIIGSKAKTVPGSPARAGRVYIYSGSTGAFLKFYASPNQEADGEFGAAVAGLSNMNGDGKGNAGVGAPKENVGGTADAGRAYIFKK